MAALLTDYKPCIKCGCTDRKRIDGGKIYCPLCHRMAVKRFYHANKYAITHKAAQKARDAQIDNDATIRRRAIEDHLSKSSEKSYYDI